MDKQLRDKLVVRLQEKRVKLNILVDNSISLGDSLDMYNINEHYLNSGYITKEQYVDLVALYDLITECKDMTEQDLKEILNSCPVAFAFLRKINRNYKDLIQDFRTKGVYWIVVTYCGERRLKEACRFNILG